MVKGVSPRHCNKKEEEIKKLRWKINTGVVTNTNATMASYYNSLWSTPEFVLSLISALICYLRERQKWWRLAIPRWEFPLDCVKQTHFPFYIYFKVQSTIVRDGEEDHHCDVCVQFNGRIFFAVSLDPFSFKASKHPRNNVHTAIMLVTSCYLLRFRLRVCLEHFELNVYIYSRCALLFGHFNALYMHYSCGGSYRWTSKLGN